VLEIIGTIAFAFSGAMIAMKSKMDVFGVCVLGYVTAVGGGIIRDLLLGITPPKSLVNPLYGLVAVASAIVVFLPIVQKLLMRTKRLYEVILLIADSVGLGIFTVVGVRVCYSVVADPQIFMAITLGMLTGVGGGVLRDMMSKRMPYIFVKHFYACASFFGAITCIMLWKFTNEQIAVIGGAVVVIILRFLAAHFHWSLPKAKPDESITPSKNTPHVVRTLRPFRKFFK
jgi:uncharacterized membrane protein YeiH